MHGFAVNVSGDLDWFRHIVPCGLADRAVASVSGLAGRRVSLEEMVAAVVPHFAAVFGYEEVEAQSAAFTRGAGKDAGSFEVDRLVAAGAFTPEGRRAALPATPGGRLPGEPERPEWMRVRADLGAGYRDVKGLVGGLALHTVCQEAGCPNIYECWAAGTATFLLLGEVCTRACSFCDVTTGKPGPLDPGEPERVAEAVARLGLRHAVLTSVDRDDLPDGGSAVFAAAIRRIRERVPGCAVEVLIPDFKGDPAALATVVEAGPEVLNHNVETVVRLQREVRTAAELRPLPGPARPSQEAGPGRPGEVRADGRPGGDAGGSAGRPGRPAGRPGWMWSRSASTCGPPPATAPSTATRPRRSSPPTGPTGPPWACSGSRPGPWCAPRTTPARRGRRRADGGDSRTAAGTCRSRARG